MFWLLVFVIAVFALAYRRASIRTSALVLGGVIVAYGVLGHSVLLFLLLALIWVAVAVPLSVPALRQEWFSRAALNAFRRGLRSLPTSTSTLLESGAAGCDAELFGGSPNWLTLRGMSLPPLSAEAVAAAEAAVESAARDRAPEATGRLIELLRPRSDGDDAAASTTPRIDARVQSLAAARLAAATDGATAWSLVGPERQGWLSLLEEEAADGRPRLGISDGGPPSADTLAVASCGLDPLQSACGWARVDRLPATNDGEDGEAGLRLSLRPGVRAAHAAKYYAMLVQFSGRGAKAPQGPACLLLPADAMGLNVAPASGTRVRLSGEAIFVPLSALVGGVRRIGNGAQRLSCALARPQGVLAPALRLGAALPLALGAAARARLHAPFLSPAVEHGAVRARLAQTAADLYAADALREWVLADVARGRNPVTLGMIADLQLAALAARIGARRFDRGGALTQVALQPPAPPVPVLAAMQLGLRALGRCHPHLRRELDAARAAESADALTQFDAAFWAHIGHVQSNAVRSLFAAIGGGALLPSAGLAPTAARCLRRIDRACANLALLADFALFSLRGRVLRNDALLAHIGEALGILHRATATLWRTQDAEGEDPRLAMLRLAVGDALSDVQAHFDAIITALPRAYLRGLARLLVFPLGRWQLRGRDTDVDDAARWLCDGGATRSFAPLLPTALPEPTQRLRRTLEATLAGEPLIARLEGGPEAAGNVLERVAAAEAAGQIDATQAGQLREWVELCDRVEDFGTEDA